MHQQGATTEKKFYQTQTTIDQHWEQPLKATIKPGKVSLNSDITHGGRLWMKNQTPYLDCVRAKRPTFRPSGATKMSNHKSPRNVNNSVMFNRFVSLRDLSCDRTWSWLKSETARVAQCLLPLSTVRLYPWIHLAATNVILWPVKWVFGRSSFIIIQPFAGLFLISQWMNLIALHAVYAQCIFYFITCERTRQSTITPLITNQHT